MDKMVDVKHKKVERLPVATGMLGLQGEKQVLQNIDTKTRHNQSIADRQHRFMNEYAILEMVK